MEHALRPASLAEARAAIAHLCLGAGRSVSTALGHVTMRPHQLDAVERLRTVLERHRVALLADDVGLGKTYVALALASFARSPLIVAPAALREMWREAMRMTAVHADIISYERLSRGSLQLIDKPDLLILDEAHHVRAPSTRRYERLASLCAGSRLLLISATPIHNRREDLTTLFALGLGRSARSLNDEAIAERTVRRTHADVADVALPTIGTREWIRIPDDDDLLDRLLALPPPLPPRGAGDGGMLLGWTLVRLWASTRGALRAALRRRVQRGWALRQALASGVLPSAEDLRAWQCSEQAVQLAFPELLAPPTESSSDMLGTVERHLEAVERLIEEIDRTPNPDGPRAETLRSLRLQYPGSRILAFTQFADSATALWRLLRRDPGVAILTSKGAEVAGGPITRLEAMERFAPLAHGQREPGRAERIDLLLCTDLLSEGVNLQDASVVVHVDLPWTHARLAQRVGRIRRIGSMHSSVRVFTFAPPASAERLLEIERRIAAKLGEAARTLGMAGTILPSLTDCLPDDDDSATRAAERLRTVVAGWRQPRYHSASQCHVSSTARAGERGALAVIADDTGRVQLVAARGTFITDDPRVVLEMAHRLDSARAAEPDERAIERECRRIVRWAESRAAEEAVTGVISIESAARRAALRRVSGIVARTPIARRHETAALAAAARRIAGSAIGAGGELILGQLAAASLPDEAWLRAIAAFADAHRDCALAAASPNRFAVLAIIVATE